MWLYMWAALPFKAMASAVSLCIVGYGFGFGLSIQDLLCFQTQSSCQGKLKNSFTFLCRSRKTVKLYEGDLIFCHCASAVWVNNWKLSCRSDLLWRVVVIYKASKFRPFLTAVIGVCAVIFTQRFPNGTQASFTSVLLFLRFAGILFCLNLKTTLA